MQLREARLAPRRRWSRSGAETPRTRSLFLEVPGWEGHKAGQHVDLRLTADDGYQAQRSYSIASAPEDERLELAVERLEDGEVSPYLTGRAAGRGQAGAQGPDRGLVHLGGEDGGPLFLVGRGLRRRAADGHDPSPRRLRQRRPMPPALLLALLRGDHLPRRSWTTSPPQTARWRWSTPSPAPRPPGWTGYARRIDREMLEEVAPSPDERPLTFVCGPTSFVEGVADALVGLGHDPARVKTERFGPTGG